MKHCEKLASRRKFITIGASSAAALLSGGALAGQAALQQAQQGAQTLTHNSVADMKADKRLKPGDTVYTLGYYHPGDDGNNVYTVMSDNSLKDDGGSEIAISNGLMATAIFPGGIVTIEQFGAIGNGEFDNTEAMRKAHQLGQVVYYGAKPYRFTTLEIESGGIIGRGSNTQLLGNAPNKQDIITFTGENGLFKDFALTTQANKTQGAGLKLAPAGDTGNDCAHIQNVMVSDLPTAIHSDNALRYTVRDCRFSNLASQAIHAETSSAEAGQVGSINIINNAFVDGRIGIVIAGTGGASATISGNTMQNQTQNAIYLSADQGQITVSQNQLDAGDSKGAAILVEGNSDNHLALAINNNQIRFGGDADTVAAIKVTNTNGFMVNNNTINCMEGKGHRGIYIDQSCNSGVLNANHVILPLNGHTLNLSKTTTLV